MLSNIGPIEYEAILRLKHHSDDFSMLCEWMQRSLLDLDESSRTLMGDQIYRNRGAAIALSEILGTVDDIENIVQKVRDSRKTAAQVPKI